MGTKWNENDDTRLPLDTLKELGRKIAEVPSNFKLHPRVEKIMEQAFIAIARHESTETPALEIEGRIINARRIARGVAWFDFRELCDGPRGKDDYIELARRYHTVLISGIPQFKQDEADIVRRFTWLVDEFYDRRVKLIVSAAAPPAQLYAWAEGGDQFERTISRLIEMQTRDYMALPHLSGDTARAP